MKRVLIINPYFPPSNAADMQRIRMSLPYFKQYGWEAVVVCVDEKQASIVQDNLLLASVPAGQVVYKINAIPKKLTQKIGLGSLGYRSLWHYRKKVNELLKKETFDLIYFSTTHFPLCILGPYWKNKFGIPYIIDMQDPWYSDYYEDKSKNERPPKYFIVYKLHKKLEAIAMRKVDGLISVSENYLQTLRQRYPNLLKTPTAVITFSAFAKDFDIVKQQDDLIEPPAFNLLKEAINCVYVGRGGYDMHDAITLLFKGFKAGLLKNPELFSNIHFYFLGTSYAPQGTGKPSVLPIAQNMGIAKYVNEQTDRLPFYQSIATLLKANGLIIPGSSSGAYTASKVYPYIMAQKPLLAIFHKDSSAVQIVRECSPGSTVVTFSDSSAKPVNEIYETLKKWANNKPAGNPYNKEKFKHFSAEEMTKKQVDLFQRVLGNT